MSDLLKIQTAFRDNIQEEAEDWLSVQVEENGLDPKQRLQIYENNVILTLADALASNFPVIKRLVGQDFFNFIARKYIIDNLPQTPLLMKYGDSFPDYLTKITALSDYPYMQNIADLEINWRNSYHAREHSALTRDEFWKILLSKEYDFQKNEVSIEFIPSLNLVKSAYPIDQIWSNNQLDNDNNEEATLINEPRFLVIFKNDHFEMNMHKVAENFYNFLEELKGESTLLQAADRFLEVKSKEGKVSGPELSDALLQLAELNIVSTIKLNEKPNK
jgi:hypothetical protein